MRQTNFKTVANITHEQLIKMNIELPEVVFESRYRVSTFTITDPITDEVIRTISLTDKELSKLPVKKRSQLKSYDRVVEFKEDEYNKELDRQKIVKDEYSKVRDVVMEDIEKSLGITEKINGAMKIIKDFTDFEDFDKEEIEDFEMDFINSLK
jgi:hypothetical protein